MKVTVELDWIDEESQVDEAIKMAVVSKVAEKISVSYEKEVKSAVDLAMKDLIDNKIEDIFNGYLSKPVIISDGWKKEEFASAEEMIITKFNAFMDGKIGGRNSCEDPYMKKVKDILQREASDKISTLTAAVQQQAKKAVDETIKANATLAALKTLVENKA